MKHRNRFNHLADNSLKPNQGYKLITLIIVFLVATALTGAAWYSYNSYKDKPEGEILVISADTDEIKVKPLNPGGMVVNNMDKSVYDTIDGNYKDDESKAERLLPPAEEPINKNTIIIAEQPPLVIEENSDNVVIIEEPVINNPAPLAADLLPSVAVSADDPKLEEEYITAVASKDNLKKKASFNKKDEKFYKVQIASFKSLNDAKKEWENLSKRFPKLIAIYSHYIVSKNIEGKGIFHRLQIGPFENENEANRACSKLKDSGVNCFLIKP